MYCRNCGGNNPDDSAYCYHCGASLGDPGENRPSGNPVIPGQESMQEDYRVAPGQESGTYSQQNTGGNPYGWDGPVYPEDYRGRTGRRGSERGRKEKRGTEIVLRILIALIALFAVTAASFVVCRIITGKYPLELLVAKDEEKTDDEEPVSPTPSGETKEQPGPRSLGKDELDKTTVDAENEDSPIEYDPEKESDDPWGTMDPDSSGDPDTASQDGTVTLPHLPGYVTPNPGGPTPTPAASQSTPWEEIPAAQEDGPAAQGEGPASQGEGPVTQEQPVPTDEHSPEPPPGQETPVQTGEVPAAPAVDTQAPVEMRLIPLTDADLTNRTLVGITAAAASSTIVQSGTSNDPLLVFDRVDSTSWQEGVSGYGVGEWLKASFDGTYKVKYLAFRLGNWKNDKYYYGNAKPKTLRILIGNFEGEITFPDERAVQLVEFSQEVDANAIEITIVDVYPGTSWADTCIAAMDIYGTRIQ